MYFKINNFKTMGIDLQTITQLRNQTGAGISDCKKALDESNGDIDKAIEILRKKGEIKAAKKSDRETNEGLVAVARDGQKAAVVVLACETDFVSRNEDFIATASDYAKKLLITPEFDFKAWVEDSIKAELVIKIGENIKLADFGVIEGAVLGVYIHSNKKTGAIVALTGGSEELANDIAMHIVAMSPKHLAPENVPAEELEKEKEIYREQMKNENKPEEIIEKIIMGKVNKYYEDVCLLNQSFIKDDSKKISDLLKEAGEGVTIGAFKKFSV
ncbi:MAG: elongation factor Ts [Candidatus Buchananbacteria bacterium CG10_big_fil_rev_8_21_14_0_10_33_19]|uniref:Elongation factor Ts n=1 Tax=Candidatus Buchananbacteria bacterium CG10_big_fil_rev_8_21_14_0_10_33_19 TaxID=1974525 RepID=A0A2H0W3K2_9BACT|nr:MAG: elongation factor Ts [Candidatus Buchananbacteria bacterium CG10_big_fil_rev_8_21_14_0_10_33_19]